MALDATARRRWLGALALGAALGLLIAGQTVLQNRLPPLGFLVYWLACFALTMLSIVVAFLDARALQKRSRQEQRDLLQSTWKEIQTDVHIQPPRLDADEDA